MSDSTKPAPALPTFIELTPFDEEFRRDPHPRLRRLREHCPVHREPEFDRVLVTSEEFTRDTLRDHSLSVDPRKALPTDPIRRFLSEDEEDQEQSMLFLDDPDHQRLRKLVAPDFTPRAVEKWRGTVREIAQDLVAAIEPDEAGEFDLVSSLGSPLPAIVIARVLGIPAEDQANFKRWSEAGSLAFFNPEPTADEVQAAEAGRTSLNEVFEREIAKRHDHPEDDLLGKMVHAQQDGDRFTEQEILTMCFLLLVAGNVTTSDLIGNGMRVLLDHPDQLDQLRRAPEKIPNAVEEMLRFDPPVTITGRIAPSEIQIGPETIAAGESMTMNLSAVNRDPAFNHDPDRFDVDRTDIQHHSFGGGAHICLGAHLARLEAQEAIGALLDRFGSLRRSEREESWKQVLGFRGLSELWVTTT